MLLGTEASAKWRRRTFWLLAILVGSYVHYRSSTPFPHGGSTAGLIYGGVALALLLLLAFFGVRKRWYRSTLGTLEGWCQSHIYLGLLVIVVVLFHAGFRFEDDVAVAALVVMAAVVASGALGALLYTFVPRALSDVESNMPVEQISTELNQLSGAMARLATDRSPALVRIYRSLARESTPLWLGGWRILTRHVIVGRDRGHRGGADERDWHRFLSEVEPAEQVALKQLLVLSRQHKELHQRLISQQRYKNLLEVWLYLHLPLTFVLLVLVAAHLVGVLYYA